MRNIKKMQKKIFYMLSSQILRFGPLYAASAATAGECN